MNIHLDVGLVDSIQYVGQPFTGGSEVLTVATSDLDFARAQGGGGIIVSMRMFINTASEFTIFEDSNV